MRVRINQQPEAGHTLLLVLMFGGVLVAALGAYLNLSSTENKTVLRSLSWNAALPMAETGIEEAMSHMAQNTNNYSADGWSQFGTNSIYTKARTNGGAFYQVNIAGGPGSTVTVTSTGTVHFLDNQYISRVVQVTARSMTFPSPLGLVAKSITLGGGAFVDSYNSTNPLYSVNGQYSPALASDQAFLGNPYSGFSISGSSVLKGYAAAPSGFAVTVQGAASVGDASWTAASTKGAEIGHATNGFSVTIPDVTAPFSSAPVPTTNTIQGTNYTYCLAGGNYMAGNLNAAGSATTMYVDGPNILYVTGAVSLASITFSTNANSRLHLYIASDVTFAPNIYGAVPKQFVVWGLPSCSSLDMSGNSSMNFTGIIYAPEAALKLTGGAQFFGAITAGSFKAGGNFKFHHDLAAGGAVQPEKLGMLTWAEIY